MKKLLIYCIALSITKPLTAMDKKYLWIKTTDNELSCIPSSITQSSNLLKVLNTKKDIHYSKNTIEHSSFEQYMI